MVVRVASRQNAAHCSFDLTASLTARPSALRPARRAIAAFITAPISFIEVAPVSAILNEELWS